METGNRGLSSRAAGLGTFTPEQVFYSSLEYSGAFPEPQIPLSTPHQPEGEAELSYRLQSPLCAEGFGVCDE